MKMKKEQVKSFTAEALHKKANEIVPLPSSKTIPELKLAKSKKKKR